MMGLLGGESDDEDGVAEEENEKKLCERLQDEAKTVLRRWLKLDIDWAEEFPELKLTSPIDVMHLLEADVGPIYKRIEESDPLRLKYGFIPRMAHAPWRHGRPQFGGLL